jgi:O-antigen ligase
MKRLLPLTFFDVFLFPMFHIGGVPYKLSMLIIIFYFLVNLKLSKYVLPIIFLIFFSYVGKFYSLLFFEEISINRTLWHTVNYFLLIAGFMFGVRQKIENVNWVFWLGVSYVLLHFIIQLTWEYSSFVVEFFDLQLRIDSGLIKLRSVGVFTNPNIAALAMNLILVFWLAAKQYQIVTLTKVRYDVILFLLSAVMVLSTASKSGLLAFFMLVVFYAGTRFRLTPKSLLSIVVLTSLLILVSGYISSYTINNKNLSSLKFGIEQALNLDRNLNKELDGSRMYKVKMAIENTGRSPIWGVGYDRSTGDVLNRVWYHSDLSEILVASGLLGLCAFLLMAYRLYMLSFVFIVPIILPGLTNAFLFTAQLAMIYFAFAGIIYNQKKQKAGSVLINMKQH